MLAEAFAVANRLLGSLLVTVLPSRSFNMRIKSSLNASVKNSAVMASFRFSAPGPCPQSALQPQHDCLLLDVPADTPQGRPLLHQHRAIDRRLRVNKIGRKRSSCLKPAQPVPSRFSPSCKQHIKECEHAQHHLQSLIRRLS